MFEMEWTHKHVILSINRESNTTTLFHQTSITQTCKQRGYKADSNWHHKSLTIVV